jgi:hypothetical protein
MIALLWACGGGAIVESERQGLPAYLELRDRRPQAATVERVRRALPSWELRSTERDEAIALFFAMHAESREFWAELERKRGNYQYIVGELRREGLPTVFAGLGYQAAHLPAMGCRAGPWMLPIHDTPLVEGPCIADLNRTWSPGDVPVVVDGSCIVLSCPKDLRYDLVASTTEAIRALRLLYEKHDRDALDTLVEAALGPPEAAIAQHLLAACADPLLGPAAYCQEFSLPPR